MIKKSSIIPQNIQDYNLNSKEVDLFDQLSSYLESKKIGKMVFSNTLTSS